MLVVWDRMKSSAVSVSSFPELGRRDNAPSRPSGLPVLKKKRAARAGVASHSPANNVAAIKLTRKFMRHPHCPGGTSLLSTNLPICLFSYERLIWASVELAI